MKSYEVALAEKIIRVADQVEGVLLDGYGGFPAEDCATLASILGELRALGDPDALREIRIAHAPSLRVLVTEPWIDI